VRPLTEGRRGTVCLKITSIGRGNAFCASLRAGKRRDSHVSTASNENHGCHGPKNVTTELQQYGIVSGGSAALSKTLTVLSVAKAAYLRSGSASRRSSSQKTKRSGAASLQSPSAMALFTRPAGHVSGSAMDQGQATWYLRAELCRPKQSPSSESRISYPVGEQPNPALAPRLDAVAPCGAVAGVPVSGLSRLVTISHVLERCLMPEDRPLTLPMVASSTPTPRSWWNPSCLYGTRVPVQTLVDYLEGGYAVDVLDNFPSGAP